MEENRLPHDHGSSHAGMLREALAHTTDFDAVSGVFKQLSDPTRLRLFWLLCHCEECVMNLSAMMEMSSPAVSHHLRCLKQAGLITSRRNGKEVYYKAADTKAGKLLHVTVEQVMDITCPE